MVIKRIIIIILSMFMGLMSYYLLVGWYNIIPWAIVAILVGYGSSKRKNAIVNGAFFGYFLFLTYIIIGYQGNVDKTSIIKFALFSILFSIVGAIAGIIGALIGNFVRNKVYQNK